MSILIRTLVVFLLIERSLCVLRPRDTRESGSSLSDVVQRKIDSEHVIFDNEKTSKEGSSSYNRGESGFNGRKQDSKSYGDQDKARKEYEKGRHSLGESEAVDQGKNSFEEHGSGYYKKGYHRTGFTNNYHKDESGNNSSFYEDSDDERGHRSLENNGGYYGQKLQDSFRDGLHDASYTERDRARQGLFDNRNNYNNYRNYFGGRNNNRYNDDRRNYLQDEIGRYHDRSGKEIYYRREHLRPGVKDYVPSFGYSHYYLDALPKDYYRGDAYSVPYSRDYRYYPHRENYYGREIYYPGKGYYGRNFRDDSYANEYIAKQGKGFDTYDGYRQF